MLLTLSVENTNIVLGVFQGENLLFTSRMATDRTRTGDEYAIAFRNALTFHGIGPENLEGGILASVVPALTPVLREAVFLALGKIPLVVGPGVKTGLNIHMDNPAALGSDLVVNAVAAAAEYSLPLIVVELDTAVTLSAIDGKGRFVGTVIAPGASVAAAALADACDQLPKVSLEAPREVIGKNTVDSMRSGTVYGAAAMVDGLLERMETQMGSSCTVVATGSLAGIIIPLCRREIPVDVHLSMKGLRRIYEKNTEKRRKVGEE